MEIRFELNGKAMDIEVAGDITVLELLREHLGLTGTKEACAVGECGACSLLVNGMLVDACLILAPQLDGQQVVTIEGLADEAGNPNDLQQAFIDFGASQCGFCTPGMIMAGEALLASHSDPTPEQVKMAIAGNLCRCTGYHQIIEAILATAERRRNGPVSAEASVEHAGD